MTSSEEFPNVSLGKITRFYPVECLPENQTQHFNRPYSLKGKRVSSDEFREGDYIDVLLYGAGEELIGWIEVSAPKDGKMPSRGAIRWLEIIADVCSMIIQHKWVDGDSGKT